MPIMKPAQKKIQIQEQHKQTNKHYTKQTNKQKNALFQQKYVRSTGAKTPTL